MLKHRFVPYMVAVGIVAFFSLSYVGYRAYQKHVQFQTSVSDTQTFDRSIGEGHGHSSKDHIPHGRDLPVGLNAKQIEESEHEHHLTSSGEYVYEINGVPHYSNVPLSQEHLELIEWRKTGKTTSYVEGYLKSIAENSSHKYQVVQRIVTPDGQIHQVIVPRDHQYEESDAILRSELDPPVLAMSKQRNWEVSIEVSGVEYSMPEEYYIIEDRYERELYARKFTTAKELGVSVAEVEKQIAAGKIDLSLSEAQKRFVDQREAERERIGMLAPIVPPMSDKPPVKVSFLPDEGEDVIPMPGWMRKRETNTQAAGIPPYIEKQENFPAHSTVSPMTDEPSYPVDTVHVPADAQHVPPESIETPGGERLSPTRRAQAEQFLYRYGTEEGLRRLKEVDPDAARQFERQRGRSPSWKQTEEVDRAHEPPVRSEPDETASSTQ